MPDEPIQPGFITRALANPYISIPLAIAAGVGSTFRRTAPAVRGTTTGLNFALQSEESAMEQEKNRRMSEALGGWLGDKKSELPPALTPADRAKRDAVPDAEYQKMSSREVEGMTSNPQLG